MWDSFKSLLDAEGTIKDDGHFARGTKWPWIKVAMVACDSACSAGKQRIVYYGWNIEWKA